MRAWTRTVVVLGCLGFGHWLLPGCSDSGGSTTQQPGSADGGARGDDGYAGGGGDEYAGEGGDDSSQGAGSVDAQGGGGAAGVGAGEGGGGGELTIPTEGGTSGAGGAGEAGMGGQPGPATTDEVTLALSSRSLKEDWVSQSTDGLEGDGESDLAWSVSFSGKADALYIVMTDSKGVPFKTKVDDNFQQWDTDSSANVTTLVGTDPRGVDTWILGVLPKGAVALANASDGSISLGTGTHELTLWAPQPLFHQLDGQYMKLLVARPGGAVSVSNLIKMPN